MIGTGIVVSHAGLGFQMQIFVHYQSCFDMLGTETRHYLIFSESILGTGTIGTTGTTRYHCNSVPVPKVLLSGS